MDAPTDLASTIRAVRFTPVRLTQGYDMGEVDHFLETIGAAAAAGQDLGPMITAARFSTTKLREGYQMSAVDDFLDTLTARSTPTAYAAPPATVDQPSEPVVPEPRAVDDGVVHEVPGLFARLFRRG